MKHTRSKAGFTLVEMLATLLIMVLLVMGMGVGMDAGSRIYRDATFEADSATLAGILNTNLGDILRYSIQVRYRFEDSTPATVDADEPTLAERLTPEELAKLEADIAASYPGAPLEHGTIQFVFTSLDYGIQDGYFFTPMNPDGGFAGVLELRNLRNNREVELVNSGAYPDLMVTNFSITYYPRRNPGIEGGYFDITYDILSVTDSTKVRHVETIVRLMND